MIEIDGSYGEGGGQILRTALSLSCLFRRPFRIFNIRRGRRKPGLMPQHLTAVRAAQLLSGAEARGDSAGSTDLSFSPRDVKSGDFFFDIGTAGSTSLVLQTLMPSLIFSRKGGSLTIRGGTHVPFSPSFDYISAVFVPFLRKLGIPIRITIESYGFYPKGGGEVRVELSPVEEIKPLTVVERGRIVRLRGYSGVGNLPLSIAERQKKAFLERTHAEARGLTCPVDVELQNVSSPGQGTFISVLAESEHSLAGFGSLGERGKRAETVGDEAARGFLHYYSTGAALDHHLPDQIVLYLALCRGESAFTTSQVTHHLTTNLWAIGLFHDFDFSVEGEIGKPGALKIKNARV